MMHACREYQEKIWLDAYGELAASERVSLDAHLDACPGCRRERQSIAQLLEELQHSAPQPRLSPSRAAFMRRTILGRVRKRRSSWNFLGRTVQLRLVPALSVAAGLLLAAWFGLRSVTGPEPQEWRQVEAQDREVIENLEILKDLDALEKLVQVVDQRDLS